MATLGKGWLFLALFALNKFPWHPSLPLRQCPLFSAAELSRLQHSPFRRLSVQYERVVWNLLKKSSIYMEYTFDMVVLLG